MAALKQAYVTAGAIGTVAVFAADSAKQRRVKKVVASASTSSLTATFRFQDSDTNVISPWFRTAGSGNINIDFPGNGFEVPAGKGLTIDNPLSDAALVLVWYDEVNLAMPG